jgi:hypothetical protein
MSKEEKNAPVKAIAKAAAPAKPLRVPAKNLPAKHIPAVQVLTTFDDLMENFRRNFIESMFRFERQP